MSVPDKNYMDRLKASMIDSFTDFISIANTDREIIYYNPAAYKMMGYSPDENPDIWTTKKLHAEGFDEFAASVIQPSVFKNGSWTGISAIRHKDGSTLPVEMTVFPLYGENGEEYGTVAVIRDINELTKMNERLKKSSELFQKVLDSAGIGIVLISMETNTIEMVNAFTEDMLNMSADEIVGRKCYDILCHNSVEFCPHINERDKKIIRGERYLERKDGTFLPIIKTGTWITIDEKDYLVDTFVDISIQKELEQNLQEAKLAAEAASHSKSEFLSRMSHEMRTPLNAIIGMTQISEKTDDVTKLKECIETIKLSSGHLLNLINDILDLSKIEEGKLELSLGAFSVQTMIQKIALLIEPKVQEKNITFVVDVDELIPPLLMGDALRLSQVLLNFLSNAVKFTPPDEEISLQVSMNAQEGATEESEDAEKAGITKAEEPGDVKQASLRFSVADKGIGISEEQLERLFNPFVQADGSITRKYGGTGLGLVISKRLVNLMGSDISVDSKPGEGAVFSFTIKLPLASEEDTLTEEQVFDNITDIFAGKKALIVDDVEINRVIAVELLKETGLEMDEAVDGLQAAELAVKNTYDVILMDIQMPGMDGYEATQHIRQAEEPFANVPIIAMSANAFKEDVERSLANGLNDHVGKPIDLNSLIAAIERQIGLGEPGEERASSTRTISFKANIAPEDFDMNYFNYDLALETHDHNDIALAILLDEFLQSNYVGKLAAAMGKKEYPTAESIARILLQKSYDFALASLASYVGNFIMNLERENYDFANMYLRDLETCYEKTCEVIFGLLH